MVLAQLRRKANELPITATGGTKVSEFGRVMRKLRLADGWWQQDLVEQLGGSFARSTWRTWSRVERPPRPPLPHHHGASTRVALADRFVGGQQLGDHSLFEAAVFVMV